MIPENSTDSESEPRTLALVPKAEPQPTLASRGRRRDSPAPASRLVTAQQASELLGIPYTTLRDVAIRGHIPVVRVPDCRRWWFDRRDLDRLVESWKDRAGGPL